jgi:hypothetical protein
MSDPFARSARIAAVAVVVAGIAIAALPTAGAAAPRAKAEASGAATGAATGPHYTRPAYGTLWVATLDALREFAPPNASVPTSINDVSPINTITGVGEELQNLSAVAIDRQGTVWAANSDPSDIVAYGPQDSGQVIPAISISGSDTGLDGPSGLAISPAGDIWVDNGDTSSIEEFAAGSHGNVAPIRTISGAATGLTNVRGIALTPDGKHLWVVDGGEAGLTPAPALEEFSTTAHGNAKPVQQISGANTNLDDTAGIAVGLGALSPIVDTQTSEAALLSFTAGAHGNATPKATIVGPDTGLNQPNLIALTATGDAWVPNFGADTLTQFAPSPAGDNRPLITLQGESTHLLDPTAVAVFTAPPSTPLGFKIHGKSRKVTLTWRSPKSTGGGLLGYVVRRAKKKSGPWRIVTSTTAKRVAKAAAGFYYDVEAYNETGDSSPTRPTKAK